MSHKISIKDYAIQKGISLAITLATGGFSNLKEGFRALREGFKGAISVG